MSESTEPNLSNADRELERALAGLAPAAPEKLDLAALSFAAGRRSARVRLFVWRAAAALLALALGTAALMRPEPRVVERVVTVEAPQSAEPAIVVRLAPRTSSTRTAAPAPAYLILRNAVLDRGMEALPQPSPASSRSTSADVIRAGDIYRLGEQL